ncbi:hypothetical protein GCM10023195_45100 [Actinoallomurus liliacearum]|uniref:F5/8 type C domain-containing protein n=1 Tax=Actinoallomurus liliacearum TaxID=1080073 RepID=A0ABP8TLA0_9ACTN
MAHPAYKGMGVDLENDDEEDSGRIRDYPVHVDVDGATWSDPIRTGTPCDAKAVRFIDLPTTGVPRWVKLEVDGARAAESVPAFHENHHEKSRSTRSAWAGLPHRPRRHPMNDVRRAPSAGGTDRSKGW